MDNLFDELFENSDSADSLDSFLNDNMQEVNDFYNSNYKNIIDSKDSIDNFILSRYKYIEYLDYSKSYVKSFLQILLDICETLNLRSSMLIIIQIVESNNLTIGSRLNAALLFMHNVNSNSVLINRFEAICQNLENAILFEDDDDSKAISTFLNYYYVVVRDTYPHTQFAFQLREKIKKSNFHFLNHTIVKNALLLDYEHIEDIHTITDAFLKKRDFIPAEIYEDFLIETDSDYSYLLESAPANFDAIRKISVRNASSSAITNRGVKILESEQELFDYLKRFGNMHKAKLQSTFASLPDNFPSKVNIIDWGCGQGIASMIFIEKYGANAVNCITLIEPSEIAIKRASLHIRKYNFVNPIKTVCKKLDKLTEQDLQNNASTTIHLFSNILDIDDYNQKHLIELITATQSNTNYFVCVSPDINVIKTERLESFKRYFETKYDSFELLLDVQNSKNSIDSYWNCNNNYKNCKCPNHPFNGCDDQWTRVIKVFSVYF